MNRSRWILAGGGMVAMLGTGSGCEDAVSAGDQLVFRDDGFARDHGATFSSGDDVRIGARFCPSFSGWVEHDGADRIIHEASHEDLAPCFEGTVSGPARWAQDCIVFDDEGRVTWSLTPTSCPLSDEGVSFQPDELVFDVVGASEVVVAVDLWRERFAERSLEPGMDRAFPTDWRPSMGDAVGVAAERSVGIPLALFHGMSGEFVAWSTSESQIQGTPRQGSPQWEPLDDGRTAVVRMSGGDELEVGFTFADGSPTPVRLVGMDSSVLTSLEIVAAYVPRPDGGVGEPLGARALARTAEGRLVIGAAVDWDLAAGNLAVDRGEPGDPASSPDYVGLADRCEPAPVAPEARSARLVARVEGLQATADLEWIADPSDDEFEPNADCPGAAGSAGCGCASDLENRGAWAGFGLLGCFSLRRRRRAPNRRRGR